MSHPWMTAAQALAQLNLKVTEHGVKIAREQLLQRVGLPLDLEQAPSLTFASAPVYQALANAQAATAVQADDFGSPSSSVRLYPFDKKIMSMCIIPAPTAPDADGKPTRDAGHVRSLLG